MADGSIRARGFSLGSRRHGVRLPAIHFRFPRPLRSLRGHFRTTEMASDLGEYEGMRPEGSPLGGYPLIL